MTKAEHSKFLKEAINLAQEGMNIGGGPFGAVVVKDGKIIGRGNNKVTSTHDPTAHAEVMAIRNACQTLGDFQLTDAVIYTSCEPCPMCLGAIYWSRLEKIYYACTRQDAADYGFDDEFIYKEINIDPSKRSIPAIPLPKSEAITIFENWKQNENKTPY
ncbi:nucleoside deaminase [Flammeovirgaceae bacterium SG7u.111]|nr:nucleoside deaminase [Flammeovirgaceae bacterium SG7u.132]WPO35161.1 nucleoside deaminase [Flammeovirgaceae bacterium SG7u.111]